MCSKSRGFTLVELLAVIAILGIVSIVALGVYNGVTTKSKQKAYDNKISQIETSAVKWAKENNVDNTTAISVNKLVVEGYLTADEANENGLSIIRNPINDENIICKTVEIKYKNGEIITNFIENSNNCSLAEQALDDTRISVQAYEQISNTKPTLNANNSLSWTNQPITLVVSSKDYDSKMISISYDYEGNTIEKNKSGLQEYKGKSYLSNEEADKYYNVFNVDAEVIYDGSIIITYKLSDGTTKSRTINVRIDKEEATASVIAKSDWVTESQKVTVKIDDGNGSGARRFYIGPGINYNDSTVDKIDLCDKNGQNCKYEKEYNAPTVGEYNIWTEDMVGNISAAPKNKLSVNNVDSKVPSCDFDFEGTMGENNWYVTKVIPKMHTSVAGISGLYYGIAKENEKDYSNYVGYNEIGRDQEAVKDDTIGADYTCAVKSLAGKGASKKATIKIDTVAPTVTIKPEKQESYVKSVTITVTARDVTSGLAKNSKVEYAWSTNGSASPTTWNSVDIPGTNFSGERGPTDEKKVTIDGSGMTGIYYLWIKNGTIKDAAGNKSIGINGNDRRYGPFYFDNTPPECSLKADGTIGKNDWFTSDVKISFSRHTDDDSGVASYGIDSYTGVKSKELKKDTKSVVYEGYIKDKVGNTNTCSITVKRDVTAPSCQIDVKGTIGDNNWYTSNIDLSFGKHTDAMSGVAAYGFGNVNGVREVRVTEDIKYQNFVGYIEDEAGNQASCNKAIKKDATNPSCSLKANGIIGEDNWFTSDVSVLFDIHDDNMSGVRSYGLDDYNGSKKATLNSDTTGKNYTGYIKDNAGNTSNCAISVKRDTVAPSCKIDAKGTIGDNNWYTSNIDLSFGKASDATSGVVAYGFSNLYGAKTIKVTNDVDYQNFVGYIKDGAGHQSTCNKAIKRDATKPSCSLKSNGTLGENGWYTSDVSVLFDVHSDNMSGVKSYGLGDFNGSKKTTLNSDTTGKNYTGYIKDNAGNTSNCAVSVKRDTVAPSCQIAAKGTVGENGWYTSNIDISFGTATDATSGVSAYGLDGIYGSRTSRVVNDTASATFTGYIKDNAGHQSSCTKTVKKDSTIPTCSLQVDGTFGSNSWYVSDVKIKFSGYYDNLSGVNSYGIEDYSTHNKTLVRDFDATTYTGYIKDNAGNKGRCSTGTIKRDATKPSCVLTASGTKGENGWYTSDVKIKFGSNTDNLSGVNTYGIGSYWGNREETRTQDTTGKDYIGYIIDNAGNTNSCSVTIKKDTVAPASSACNGVYVSGTMGKNNWYTSNVSVGVSNYDVEKFTVSKKYHKRDASYGDVVTKTYYAGSEATAKSSGWHNMTVRVYDDAGNGRKCDNFTIKIDKDKPSIYFTTEDPGCPPDAKVKYRKGYVSDGTSGMSRDGTLYYIGTSKYTTIHNNPVTPTGNTSGEEGFCSGLSTLYTSYTICDVAGNCTSGSKSWS